MAAVVNSFSVIGLSDFVVDSVVGLVGFRVESTGMQGFPDLGSFVV